jgi:hypothetical protein
MAFPAKPLSYVNPFTKSGIPGDSVYRSISFQWHIKWINGKREEYNRANKKISFCSRTVYGTTKQVNSHTNARERNEANNMKN